MENPNKTPIPSFRCKLCFKVYDSYLTLTTHESNKHLHNKTIPHFDTLSRPSQEQIVSYTNSFVVLIKKNLGFSKRVITKKRFSIDAFPENIFVYLFKDEESFNYSPAKTKYSCCFKGVAGETRLKQILQYDQWSSRQDLSAKTRVLLEGDEQVVFRWSQILFSDNDKEFKLGKMSCNFKADSEVLQENTPTLETDLRERQENAELQENGSEENTYLKLELPEVFQENTDLKFEFQDLKTYSGFTTISEGSSSFSNDLRQPEICYILPRPPLQDLNQSFPWVPVPTPMLRFVRCKYNGYEIEESFLP